MNKKIPKARTIYDNYDLCEMYPDDELKATAIELGWIDEDEEITDEMMMQWRYQEAETDWECEKERLTEFFDGKTVGFFGEVGLWDGVYKAGSTGEFWDLFNKAIKDCDYIRIYDENGHFYLTASHHDGTVHFEVKEITDKGTDYLERWEDNWDDKRTKQQVHTKLFDRYSRLPRFAEKVFGCPKVQYEPQSKEGFKRQLANQARSFYS